MRKYRWQHMPVVVICSHTDRKKYGYGLCRSCYKKQHYINVKTTFSPEEFRLWVFNSHIRSRYNITQDWYRTVFEKQDGKCPCGRVFGLEKNTFPCVDHNHICCPNNKSCGKCVRGLLCLRCNQVLGMLDEDPRLLPAYLLTYIQNYAPFQKSPIS